MTGRRVDLRKDSGDLREARAGELLLLSGPLLAARDAAQERLAGLVSAGGQPPFPLSGSVLFYMSPAPGRGGLAVSSAGPTTSARMDRHLAMLADLGVIATIGKGPRSAMAAKLCAERSMPYLAAVGGAGAFYARRITGCTVLCWEDLGPEAVHLLEVTDFPAFVGISSEGVSMFPASGGV
ncbi:MAG: fumarate hydratase C-terminal domain-containing protein [Candidatus Fermentibacter sp.]|nr:fumarate hydratase C-terminal domain-containing protein [Candidatus Fermentibacter sp.]